MMRTLVVGVLLLSTLASGASLARAQACEEGRVRTSRHCCWPGQEWSGTARACEGIPQCPATMVEEGDGCVPRSSTAPVAAPVIVPVAPVASAAPAPVAPAAADARGWPLHPSSRDAVVSPVLDRHIDVGLVVAGSILAAVGGAGAGVGFAIRSADGLGGIPFWAGGGALFIAGLIMLIAGAANPVADLAPSHSRDHARLELHLDGGPSGSEIGLGASLWF